MKRVNPQSLIEQWNKAAFPLQLEWFDARDLPFRSFLREWYCGLTYAMAVESVIVYMETGRKQVFIGPSTMQAEVFKAYIRHYFGLKRVSSAFVFMSPQLFVARGGIDTPFDVYVDNYLWSKPRFMNPFYALLNACEPVRQTWMTHHNPAVQYHMLERVTHTVSRQFFTDKSADCAVKDTL